MCSLFLVAHRAPNSCSFLRQTVTDFQNSSTPTLSWKSEIKRSSKISPYLKRVATLPCEIFASNIAPKTAAGDQARTH